MRRALALVLALLPGAAAAQVCSDTDYAGNRYTICEVDAGSADLRLFLRDGNGDILGQFTAVNEELARRGETLAFAMNAGMYHRDRAPVGYYVEDGQEQMRIIATPGPGNFGLLPNGIFCIREGRADVIETRTFQAAPPDCTHATQSGPMLVVDGALHPKFLPDSHSRYIRNGVGTSPDGQRAVFVISRGSVTFHEFATLFRDYLKLPNALFLDGNISRLYAPAIERRDAGFNMGPIVGVVVK